MGKTHLFMGITAAAVLTQPDTVGGCLAVLMGGAAGGVLSDIDVKPGKGRRDDPDARLMAGGICVLALMADYLMGSGITAELNTRGREQLYLGAGCLILLCLFGYFQPHREFTHSFLALALFSGTVGLISPTIQPAFAAGFFSHIALDVLNKKPVRLLFPIGTGFCLKLCYADKTVNRALMYFGIMFTVLFYLYIIYLACYNAAFADSLDFYAV